ncbi:mannitol-1-phosphate 5-dehydrogenase [Tothia fuscella]|uniref:Mannitol-1-phosphate 5-dehydrogenase n=1 Tax=Tothia fuscella TaxID=1048955 RepID=A0A9P4TYE7_9PEZI|nr:mannitol-1-phosphate 5-dehydrogenase [Tothia fuscella]
MPYDKKAIHFGGGNIGRGFVAEFLHNSGYEVVFVDVMDSIIDSLQKNKSYTVTEIGDDGERTFTIDHYRAINSKHEEQQVIDEIATADTVTCAVGPNILKFLAPVIAKGIEARKLDYPLAVIACENMIGATDALRGFIEQKLAEDTLKNISSKARFANSAIDRIVPNQDANAGLNVKIEKFFEWCVESKPFDGTKNGAPKIEGIHYVEDLRPYIERKLFTVNTSHATAAYYGTNRGIPTIDQALADKEVHDIVRDVLKETANLIVKEHGIAVEEQNDYVEKIIKRISNPALEDKVERVGRAPLRKLSRKERFIGPAAKLAELGESYEKLLGSVEMAYRFQDIAGDEESAELAKILKENDAKTVVTKVNGIEEGHPLFADLVKVVEKVQKK